MDIDRKCGLCFGIARFFCECQQGTTYWCPVCVTAHLAHLQHQVHQVQNLPGSNLSLAEVQMNPPDLVKYLSGQPVARLFYALNPGHFEAGEVTRTEIDRQPIRLSPNVPTASDMERLTRDLPVDDLFICSHAHSQRQPRKPKATLFTFQPNSTTLCFLTPREDGIMWSQSPRIFPSGAGVCILSIGLIVCTGGYFETLWLSDVFALEQANGRPSMLPGMIAARECHGCVEYREHLYVFGGVNECGLMSQCERYSLSSRTWQGLPCLEKPMSKLTPVVLNNRIYLAGYGHTAVLEFNPSTLKFKSLFGGMLSPTEAVCAFTCGEHLFLLQGAFLVCADVAAGNSSQPARRKADHRHWYSPTPPLQIGGCVYFCRWHEEVWEFGLEHCTMRQLLVLDFPQFS